MFLEKLKALLIVVIALTPIQCEDLPECPKGEKKMRKCWQVEIVSCESRVKTINLSCSANCVCANAWHVRDADNECIQVWKCPGICPPNSHFLYCNNKFESSYVELGYPLAEFKEICQQQCACDQGFEPDSANKTCLLSKSNGGDWSLLLNPRLG